jgi:hypothetical protein
VSTKVFHNTSASLVYTPLGGIETTHNLALPLGIMRVFRPQRVISLYDWWSEDLENNRTVSIGSGVHEVIFGDRFNDEPNELQDLIWEAIVNKVTVTYIPVASGNEYPFKIIGQPNSTPGSISIEQDEQRWGAGEWQTLFHARRIDGGNFNNLLATNT